MSGFLQIETDTISWDEFLKLAKKYKHFRIKFTTKDKEPFKYVYFRINKKELFEMVRMGKLEVGYEIRFNSLVDKTCDDILYVHTTKMTLFNKSKKEKHVQL